MTVHRRAVDRQCYSVSSDYCEQTTCIYSNNSLNLLLLTEIDVAARESDYDVVKPVHTLQPVVRPTLQPAGWTNIHIMNE